MDIDTKEELQYLSFQMMLNITEKLQIENSHYLDQKNGYTDSNYYDKESMLNELIRIDKEGYAISLEFNEFLLKNGQRFNKFMEGPDAVNIATENLLHKYGLQYPISWYIEYEDKDGLHFGYNKSDKINIDHKSYLNQVETLFINGKISETEKQRLITAGEYYKEHHKLLSKYFNGEQLEKTTEKGHTR